MNTVKSWRIFSLTCSDTFNQGYGGNGELNLSNDWPAQYKGVRDACGVEKKRADR